MSTAQLPILPITHVRPDRFNVIEPGFANVKQNTRGRHLRPLVSRKLAAQSFGGAREECGASAVRRPNQGKPAACHMCKVRAIKLYIMNNAELCYYERLWLIDPTDTMMRRDKTCVRQQYLSTLCYITTYFV